MDDHRGFLISVDFLFYMLFKVSIYSGTTFWVYIKSGESGKVVKDTFYLIEFINPRNDWEIDMKPS